MLLPKYGGRKDDVGEDELNKDNEESIEIEANLSTCESSSRSASYNDSLMTSSSEARLDANDINRVEDNDERDDIDEHSDQEEMALIDDVVRRVTERIVSNGGVLTIDNFVIVSLDKDPVSEERVTVEEIVYKHSEEMKSIEEAVLPFSDAVQGPGQVEVDYECLAVVVKIEVDGFVNAIKDAPTVDYVADGCNESINFSGQTMQIIQAQAINTIRGIFKTVGPDSFRGLIECVNPLLVSTFSDDSQQGKRHNPVLFFFYCIPLSYSFSITL